MYGGYQQFIPVYPVVGFITMTWAYLELALDLTTWGIFYYCGGNSIQKEIPISLKRKLKFNKLAFKQLPILEPYKVRALEFIDKITALSKKRHDLIHGVALQYVERDSAIRLMRIEIHNESEPTDIYLDITSLAKLAVEIENLTSGYVRFSKRLADELFPLKPKQ